MDGLLANLGSDQIAEWMAFYSLEPNPEDRADFRMARVAQILVELQRNPKRNPQPTKLGDFLIDWQAGTRPVDQQALGEKIIESFKRLGGVVVKRKKKV